MVTLKRLMILILLVIITSSVTHATQGNAIKIQAKPGKSLAQILKKGNGPYLISGVVYVGNSDGTNVSDGIFSCFRYKTTHGPFKKGSLYYGLTGSSKIKFEKPILVDYEMALYKNGKLLRTIWGTCPLKLNSQWPAATDGKLIDFDTIKYKCALYNVDQINLIPHNFNYKVENLKLPTDLPRIISELKEASHFQYFRFNDTQGQSPAGLVLNNDHYVDANGKRVDMQFGGPLQKINSDKDFEFLFSENPQELFNYSNVRDSDFAIQRVKTQFYCNPSDTSAQLNLYKVADNETGYTLDRVIRITGAMAPTNSEIAFAQDPSQIVTFADPNLESVVLGALNKKAGPISKSDVESIRYLQAFDKRISSLEGIQYLTNLVSLEVTENQIVDLSPIKGLINLKQLSVGQNKIVDLSPISNLQKLDLLDLHTNQIQDISVIKNLPRLKYIYLFGNPINDLTPATDRSDLTISQP